MTKYLHFFIETKIRLHRIGATLCCNTCKGVLHEQWKFYCSYSWCSNVYTIYFGHFQSSCWLKTGNATFIEWSPQVVRVQIRNVCNIRSLNLKTLCILSVPSCYFRQALCCERSLLRFNNPSSWEMQLVWNLASCHGHALLVNSVWPLYTCLTRFTTFLSYSNL